MNLEYLKNEIIPIREREIKEGKNLATAYPIYVVLSLRENACEGHSEFINSSTNRKGKEPKFGYIDMGIEEAEDRKFKKKKKKMSDPVAVTLFWTDSFEGFFFTSEAAYEYKKYQAHNMKDPYVYVFTSGYRNLQMNKLLDDIEK